MSQSRSATGSSTPQPPLDRAVVEVAAQSDDRALNYQPVVDLLTQAPRGVEALARWSSPALAHLDTGSVVRLLTDAGCAGDLAVWVGNRAVADASGWGAAAQGRDLCVNVDPACLVRPRVHRALLLGTVAAAVLDARLVVELTESSPWTHASVAAANDLAACGVALALDDFGHGFAELPAMVKLRLSVLKLDRSQVHALRSGSSHDVAELARVVACAHDRGMTVVAEGIETEADRDNAIGVGADQGQGWLWSRAVRADQVVSALTGLDLLAQQAPVGALRQAG